jgi:hypothetical protein
VKVTRHRRNLRATTHPARMGLVRHDTSHVVSGEWTAPGRPLFRTPLENRPGSEALRLLARQKLHVVGPIEVPRISEDPVVRNAFAVLLDDEAIATLTREGTARTGFVTPRVGKSTAPIPSYAVLTRIEMMLFLDELQCLAAIRCFHDGRDFF